jgi:hypothetical protein
MTTGISRDKLGAPTHKKGIRNLLPNTMNTQTQLHVMRLEITKIWQAIEIQETSISSMHDQLVKEVQEIRALKNSLMVKP